MTITQGQTPSMREQASQKLMSPLALLDLLQDYVHETDELIPRSSASLAGRSYELLELTDTIEIWAIHWPKDQGLELHDHGGSVGALWVLDGTLEEHYLTPEKSLARRSLVSGGGAAFGPRYIHDVVNTLDAPATTVHAYSPPMPSMTFYRLEHGQLHVNRAEYRADPTWAP